MRKLKSISFCFAFVGMVVSSHQSWSCEDQLSLGDKLRNMAVNGDEYLEMRLAQEDNLEKFREIVRQHLPELLVQDAAEKRQSTLLVTSNSDEFARAREHRGFFGRVYLSWYRNANQRTKVIGFRDRLLFGDKPSPYGNAILEFCEANGLRCQMFVEYQEQPNIARVYSFETKTWTEQPSLTNTKFSRAGLIVEWGLPK